MDGGGNASHINDLGHYVAEGFVEAAVVATDTDEHAYFTKGKGLQTVVFGLAVAAKGYPDDAATDALEGIPCGVDATRSSVVYELEAMDACHVFESGISLVETSEAGTYVFVTHVAQTRGVNCRQSAMDAVATLIC